MNYELAKKLKDAGFPESDGWFEKPGRFIDRESGTPVPTLSELIEACGDGFEALIRMGDKFGCQGFQPLHRTPTEAVANLWLALNEKK